MRISVLGPVRVDADSGPVLLSAAKERSLLSALALRPGSVVSTASLTEALWGDDPPPAARKTLQTYVWNLRRTLGTDTIATEAPGYVLRLRPEDVDVNRFRALVRQGEEARRDSANERARARLAEAVALWRGHAMPDALAGTWLSAEGVRLEEEHLSALEARVAADLAAGAHEEVIGELEAMVREHPFRERLWGHLMVALYRSGRQTDALAAYQRARQLLVSELGLEPGGELRRLEAAVLGHDPALIAPAPAVGTRSDAVVRSAVRYARCADGTSIAFQVSGTGPIDILAVAGFVSHLDIWWNAPTDRLVRRLASMGRLISFDKRGMGLSDRPDVVDAERWVDDALAVLDAVGSERAVVLGVSAGAITALRLASTHPDRVRALAVHGGFARMLAAPGYDIGLDPALVEGFTDNLHARWGTGVAISQYAPSRATDEGVRDYWARYQQLSAGPASAMRYLAAATDADVRDVLPTIRVPTLVLHAERDRIVPVAQGRYIADHIPGARFVGLDSDVHLICASDVIDETTDAIEDFIARAVPADDVEPVVVTALAVGGVSASGPAEMEAVLSRCGGRVQGVPGTATFDSPARAIRAAATLLAELRPTEPQLAVGIHSGECVPGAAGFRGVAIDVARELAAKAQAGEVLATRTVRELIAGVPFDFVDRGVLPGPGATEGLAILSVVPRDHEAVAR